MKPLHGLTANNKKFLRKLRYSWKIAQKNLCYTVLTNGGK